MQYLPQCMYAKGMLYAGCGDLSSVNPTVTARLFDFGHPVDFATSTVYILVVRTCGENRIMIWYNGWLNATKHIESIYFQQAHHTHTTFPNRISRTAHCEIAAKIYIYTYTYMTTCLGALGYQLLFSDTLWNTHCIVPAASKCPCPNRPRTTSGKLNTSSFGDCIVPDANLILGFVW